jgi:flagellar motor component MotA
MAFALTKAKSIKKKTKENLKAEQQKILKKIKEEKRCLSKEERQSYVNTIQNIRRNGREKARKAIEEEMSSDDLKTGHKEIMDDFTKNDIRDLLK